MQRNWPSSVCKFIRYCWASHTRSTNFVSWPPQTGSQWPLLYKFIGFTERGYQCNEVFSQKKTRVLVALWPCSTYFRLFSFWVGFFEYCSKLDSISCKKCVYFSVLFHYSRTEIPSSQCLRCICEVSTFQISVRFKFPLIQWWSFRFVEFSKLLPRCIVSKKSAWEMIALIWTQI